MGFVDRANEDPLHVFTVKNGNRPLGCSTPGRDIPPKYPRVVVTDYCHLSRA